MIDRIHRFASVALCVSLLVTGLSSPCEATPGKKEITLDVIYAEEPLVESLPSSVTWLPDSSAFVFVETEGRGDDAKKSVHRMDAKTGKRTTVLEPEEFDELLKGGKYGVERPSGRAGYRGFNFSKDGRKVLIQKKGDLHLVDLEKKSSTRLTASAGRERHATFSPDGKRIAYVRDHNVYVLDLESRLEIQITKDGHELFTFGESDWVYDEELSLHTGYWWSPDGKHLAILNFDESEIPVIPIVDFIPTHKKIRNQRYPKAGDTNPTVELYVARTDGEGELVHVDLPQEPERYLARVSFLPGGRGVVAQLLNRKQDTLRWYRCDLEKGTSEMFFEEKSPYWINVHDDYHFLEDGRFVYASERDGYNHLYLFSKDGKPVRKLTSGRWVVTGISAVDEATGTIYFHGTEKSPLERHLYKVSLTGKGFVRLTEGDGTHGINMAPDGSAFLDTSSSATSIPRVDLFTAAGKKITTVAENSREKLDELAFGEIEFFTVNTEDGRELPASLIKPHDFDPKKRHPVLFYIYGGPLSQVVRDRWGGSRYLWHQMLANQGVLVFSIDNRASLPMGLGSAGVIYGRLCEVELSDFVEGAKHLAGLPYVDAERIGIWGWSYGGTMAAYSILHAPETFKVAVSVAPVTDWRNYDTIYTERYMNTPQNNEDGYDRTSVVKAAEGLQGQLLISHGTADDNVHFQNAVQLVKSLTEEDKNFEFLMYPGGRHGIGGSKVRKQMFRHITGFLLEHLGGAGSIPAATVGRGVGVESGAGSGSR